MCLSLSIWYTERAEWGEVDFDMATEIYVASQIDRKAKSKQHSITWSAQKNVMSVGLDGGTLNIAHTVRGTCDIGTLEHSPNRR